MWLEYFDDASENKLIYMDLSKEYTILIENFPEARLKASIEDFSMDELFRMIQGHEGMCVKKSRTRFIFTELDEITGDVIDVLMSCADFDEFNQR